MALVGLWVVFYGERSRQEERYETPIVLWYFGITVLGTAEVIRRKVDNLHRLIRTEGKQ